MRKLINMRAGDGKLICDIPSPYCYIGTEIIKENLFEKFLNHFLYPPSFRPKDKFLFYNKNDVFLGYKEY